MIREQALMNKAHQTEVHRQTEAALKSVTDEQMLKKWAGLPITARVVKSKMKFPLARINHTAIHAKFKKQKIRLKMI